MDKTNDKEIKNLLDSLSNSDSDISDLVLAPRKRKVKRRSRSGARAKQRDSRICSRSQSKIASLWLAAVLITFWLIALSWLAAALYSEIGRIDISVRSVRAGNEGVPDALQKCHSLSRDLQNNQTTIFNQLSELKVQLNNFTVQLSGIQQGLHQVQESLKAAPELTNVPESMKELSNSVASFGSQIRDLDATVKTLKETDAKLQDVQITVQQNISDMQHSLLDLTNVTSRPQSPTNESRIKVEALSNAISQLASNLTHINETLTRNITWIAEDQAKDHTTLVKLQDMTQNASVKVMTLQEVCAKASEQTSLIATVKKLNDQMNEIHTIDINMSSKVKQLEQSYNSLKSSATAMQTSISEMKNQQEVEKIKDEASSHSQPPSSRSHDIETSTNVPSEHENTG